MKNLKITGAVMLAITILIVAPSYFLFWYTSAELDKDRNFLDAKPTEAALIERFGPPLESIGHGKTFRDTGFRPLPDQKAEHDGDAFLRFGSTKIYVFMDGDNRVAAYHIAGT